jgi:hypothetical protein
MDWNDSANSNYLSKVNKQPDTQYNVFSLKVKYIMLCMDLWRQGEYPVDNSWLQLRVASAKAFTVLQFAIEKKRV